MSNYVNNVNVQNTTYALGPLMSTASGGIVDNQSTAYSSYNNCIIHADVYAPDASMLDSNLILNTNVSAGQYAEVIRTTIIGGGGLQLADDTECYDNTFINCSVNNSAFIYTGACAGNTFIGLYGQAINPGINTNILLTGVNNVVQGSASYVNSVGMHAVATKTINMYVSYDNNTGISFPNNCYGMYTITVTRPKACDKFDFVVKNKRLQSDFRSDAYYYSNSYYYCSSTGSVGISIDNGTLYLYTPYGADNDIAQVTLSYDVIPYTGGSGSSSY